MSANEIDVLAVMDALCEVADEHQDEGPDGCGWASDKLSKLRAEGPEARAAVAELIAANVELAESNADPAHTLGRDLRVINAEKRLHAALARVTGGDS